MKKAIFVLVTLALVISACEKRYGRLSEGEVKKLEQAVSKCLVGKVVKKEVEGTGLVLSNVADEVVLIYYGNENEPTKVGFVMNNEYGLLGCLRNVFGKEAGMKVYATAIMKWDRREYRPVALAYLNGYAVECYGVRGGAGAECLIGYSTVLGKIDKLEKGMCVRMNKILTERGYLPRSCVEAF